MLPQKPPNTKNTMKTPCILFVVFGLHAASPQSPILCQQITTTEMYENKSKRCSLRLLLDVFVFVLTKSFVVAPKTSEHKKYHEDALHIVCCCLPTCRPTAIANTLPTNYYSRKFRKTNPRGVPYGYCWMCCVCFTKACYVAPKTSEHKKYHNDALHIGCCFWCTCRLTALANTVPTHYYNRNLRNKIQEVFPTVIVGCVVLFHKIM